MKTALFVILLLLVATSCRHIQHDHLTAGQSFTKQYANEMRRSHNWIMFGSEGGYYKDINKLSFKFIAYDNLDVNAARKLIVENIEHLYELINADPRLSPYLTESPFGRKRITLCIMFFKSGSIDFVAPHGNFIVKT